MQTPRTGSHPPLRFVSDSDDEFTYSTDEEAKEIDFDSFDVTQPIARAADRPSVPEPMLVVAVRNAINEEDLRPLQKLLEDPQNVKSLNEGPFNAMDQALKMYLRDKQSNVIPHIIKVLKEKGAVPKSMTADAIYWRSEALEKASALVQVAKLLTFDGK